MVHCLELQIARTAQVMYEVMSLIATYMGAQHTQASICAVPPCTSRAGRVQLPMARVGTLCLDR